MLDDLGNLVGLPTAVEFCCGDGLIGQPESLAGDGVGARFADGIRVCPRFAVVCPYGGRGSGPVPAFEFASDCTRN